MTATSLSPEPTFPDDSPEAVAEECWLGIERAKERKMECSCNTTPDYKEPPRLICTCGNDRWIKTHVMEHQKLGHVAWQCDKCGEVKHTRIPKPKGQVVYLEEES